ncbi:hypothetical protein [Chloroflexus sp.]|uniref:hypothetical protein n=1 Tax=Chloroflexus sp. TaxID=1904827 RepID=UPI002ACD21ED|nr:hypothetical protein [Chloroflexus sp.]
MATTVTVIIHDIDAHPQPGLVVSAEDGVGQSYTLTTDERGTAEVHIEGASIWIREIATAEGAVLQMDSNTDEGGMRFPLDGTPLIIAFARDGALLFRVPFELDDPAFPDGVPGTLSAATAGVDSTAVAGGNLSEPILVSGDVEPEAGGNRVFWLIVGGLILAGVGLGLFVWAQARASQGRQRHGAGTRRRGR